MNYEPGDITFESGMLRIYTHEGYMHFIKDGQAVFHRLDQAHPNMQKSPDEPVLLTLAELFDVVEEQYVNSVRK